MNKNQPAFFLPRANVNQQLDWNNPEHRRLWILHIRSNTLVNLVRSILPSLGPEGVVAGMLVEPVVTQLHLETWGETYRQFPEMESQRVTFMVERGSFINTPEEDG